MVKKIFLFLALLFFCFLGNAKDTQLIKIIKNDSVYYKEFPIGYFTRDTDSICYALIDSAWLKPSTAIRDSVMVRYKTIDYNYLNQQNQAKLKDGKYYQKRKQNQNWTSFLAFGILVYMAIIKSLYAKNIPIIFQAYWNDRVIGQFTRDDNFFKLRSAALFFIFFCGIFALLSFIVLQYFSPELAFRELFDYYRIFLIVSGFYFGKYLVMKLSGYLFNIQREISGYLAIISISNLVYVFLIVPILLFYQFLPVYLHSLVIYLLLFLWLFNTFYKYLRSGSFIISNFQFPKFYLFIYLCTLEIMPLLVIYKLFIY